MKLFIRIAIISVFTSITLFFLVSKNQSDSRKEYENYLVDHQFLNRDYSEVSKLKKQDRPDLGWELDYILTMDPQTKKPERERLLSTYQEQKELKKSRVSGPGQVNSPWVERGPDNVAGRTRAVVFDPNVTNKVWAGSVAGGLWYNLDITDDNSAWVSVDDFWDNLSITSIAFDPNESSTMYVGTGEGWGTGAARGEGIWKSSDSGQTWSQLQPTANYYYVNDIVVRDESNGASEGVVYAASSRNFHRGQNHGSNAVYISADGGSSFSSVTDFTPTDLSIAADNRIWAGTANGQIWFSDNGTSWTQAHESGFGRVAIATAPSDENYVYGLIENNSAVETIIVSTDRGATWTALPEPADVDNGIPDTDFTRGQAWYDLVIAVDPNDENTVVVGGIDLFRSTDAGQNWTQISKWSNNNNLSGLSVSFVHADQHGITFKGAGSNEVLFGNDGGVFYSVNLENAGTQSLIPSRINNYNVTQYYACAIHPEAGRDFFLAGSQDNGSQRYTSAGLNSTVTVNGGDGAFCFIDQTDPTYQITSYVFNVYDLSTNEGQSFFTNLQNDQNSGLFINPADYDDNQDILYSSKDENSINRITGITGTPSVGSIAVSLGSITSHLRVSPYTTGSTTLFAGTVSGRVFKIGNADSDSPTSSEITGASFPNGSISSIEIGADENELLVTFSNYGVTSVWYTSDGGSNWVSKEGNLPDMPVRWALFNPNNRSEVLLATELGVWSSTNIESSSPTWSSSNSGLANVRTDMLQLRNSDNEVIAATHGRGLFSSNGFQAEAAPNVDFTADAQNGCGSSLDVNFTNLTSANPAVTSFAWTFEGGTPSSSTSETPPTVTYATEGSYTVTLTATNSVGVSTETKTDYITLGSSFSLPLEENFDGETFPPACWSTSRGSNGLGTTNDWGRVTNNTNSGAGAAYVQYESVSGENAEDWLITPEINLESISNTSLSFYSRQTYGDEYGSSYHIRVSTSSATDLSSFENVITYTESDFSATSFEQFTVDLSDYDGMNIFVAFVLEQNDGDDWYIDDFALVGETSSLSISASNGLDICEDETTVLSIPGESGATYQWSLNGSVINGATSNEYTPTSSGTYIVSQTLNGSTEDSNSAIVSISTLPTITSQPVDLTTCEGEDTSFSITASGDNLSYQWQFENTNISDDAQFSGSQTSTLSISSIDNSNEGTYTCIVTSGSCQVSSNIVDLTSLVPTTISSQPASQAVCTDDEVTFEVIATGTNLSFQWYKDDVILTDDNNISGASTNAITIKGVSMNDAGEYICEITSDCEAVESSLASLNVDLCLGTDKTEIEIYPNPVTSFLSIRNSKEALIEVYSMDGSLVITDEVSNNDTSISVDHLQKGATYIVKIITEGGVETRKIIKR